MTTTHSPGEGGLFASSAACGADADASTNGLLRLSERDVDCPVCVAITAGRFKEAVDDLESHLIRNFDMPGEETP